MRNLLELWQRNSDLKELRYKLLNGRKRISQKEYRIKKAAELRRKNKVTKTYAEYVAEAKKRSPSVHLMPPSARPKYSKGDTPAARERIKETQRRGLVDERDLPITTNGFIDSRKMKPIRRKIYRIQEASHGR